MDHLARLEDHETRGWNDGLHYKVVNAVPSCGTIRAHSFLCASTWLEGARTDSPLALSRFTPNIYNREFCCRSRFDLRTAEPAWNVTAF